MSLRLVDVVSLELGLAMSAIVNEVLHSPRLRLGAIDLQSEVLRMYIASDATTLTHDVVRLQKIDQRRLTKSVRMAAGLLTATAQHERGLSKSLETIARLEASAGFDCPAMDMLRSGVDPSGQARRCSTCVSPQPRGERAKH